MYSLCVNRSWKVNNTESKINAPPELTAAQITPLYLPNWWTTKPKCQRLNVKIYHKFIHEKCSSVSNEESPWCKYTWKLTAYESIFVNYCCIQPLDHVRLWSFVCNGRCQINKEQSLVSYQALSLTNRLKEIGWNCLLIIFD